VALFCFSIALLSPFLSGCKKQSAADATQPLQQSFQTAEPEVKQAIDTVNTSLRAGDYVEATRALAPVVANHPLTDPQRQAVGVALQQISQAIAVNPALDSKEMYDLRLKLYRAYDSGKRF
jgi:uncharacterized caspase-like protein